MTDHLRKGSAVTWTWGAHEAHGKIAEIFTRRVQRIIEGKKIVRNGTATEPVYLVEQADGGRALKSQSELRR